MWKSLVVAAISTAFFTGCASWLPEQKFPRREELIGVYYWGDGTGANRVLRLRENGICEHTLLSHLDSRDKVIPCRWSVIGKQVCFGPAAGANNAPEVLLTCAESFYYRGRPAFVRAEDLDHGTVSPSWVYSWHSRE
jgi:hypothetical protein